MKLVRFLTLLVFFVPCVCFGAGGDDFQNAAKLLSAARRGDVQTVQVLISSGTDVNYVDSTGLSLVCTAVMNNDVRAIQILQMYGADASECDRQIKDYKQKSKRATKGEEFGFFSGLSSSHVLALSAVGVAAVIGGVALLSDALDKDNENIYSSSGGTSGGGGGSGGGGSGTTTLTVPYAPAYLTTSGTINKNFKVADNLTSWDTGSHASFFDYLKIPSNPSEYTNPYFLSDGLNSRLQNYLLMMGGYYSLASYYFGQIVFRDTTSHEPLLSATGNQRRPIRVALITGNGINPSGSAGFGTGIVYSDSTSIDAAEYRVDKYLNNSLGTTVVDGTTIYSHNELSGGTGTNMFDLSGSGTVFNPFANVNETALAKIVAGWEADGEAMYDLYGFVPRGQLAIYRTGNGYSWNVVENSADRTYIGDFNDNSENPDGVLSVGDTITIGDFDYEIVTALSQTTITNPTITIGGTEYSLSEDSPMFIAKCPAEAEGCTDFAIYVGLDGAWYIKNTGGNYDIDAVYILTGNEIFTYKTKETADYQNFSAMYAAMQSSFSGNDSHNPVGVDVIANTNILSSSRDNNYITVNTFSGYANAMGETDLSGFYLNKIGEIYGASQGGINGAANDLFGSYGNNDPMLIMPAGEYLYRDSSLNFYLPTPTATFENYAPLIYENLNHNFMTIIAVSHDTGTSAASTISGYGNGVGSDYGPLSLSIWYDSTDPATANVYSSRRCGIAGVGDGNIDPWCFAAAGPTAEMATASAAGAVASLKSAFDYMTNDQIFALLALTADGPYLATSTDPTRPDLYTPFSDETLVVYLKSLYRMPNEYEYNISSLSDAEYLELFKEVFGYGLINLERAIRPGRSVSYYSSGHIVLASGDAYWRSGSMAHASNVLSLTGSGSITTSFYDVLESIDGALSLPRIWTHTIAVNDLSQYGLYMGDVLGDFDIDSNRQKSQKIGGLEFAMSLSPREYNDNLNGLDNLRIAFSDNRFGLAAEYQRYLTDGESRFAGRANGVLALASNALSSDAEYKIGNFSFGVRAFNGVITDESLLENDPVVSSQYEPGRLGFVNGGLFATKYKNDKFAFDVSVGIMNETNTVLGMYSDGLLSIGGGKTQYVDAVADYKPTENVRLSLRGTFAKTRVNEFGGVISDFSDIKSNAFALGVDIGGFGFTVAAPLAVVDGKMGYDYADFEIVENNGRYELAMNNAHTEYIDLAANNRELRFTTSYKKSFGETTDAGIEFMYRVNPGNIDTFGNESILMLKIHHRIGL